MILWLDSVESVPKPEMRKGLSDSENIRIVWQVTAKLSHKPLTFPKKQKSVPEQEQPGA